MEGSPVPPGARHAGQPAGRRVFRSAGTRRRGRTGPPRRPGFRGTWGRDRVSRVVVLVPSGISGYLCLDRRVWGKRPLLRGNGPGDGAQGEGCRDEGWGQPGPLAPDAGGQGRRRGHGCRPGMWSGGDDCRVPGLYGTCQQPAGGPPPDLKPSVRRGCKGWRPPSQGQGRRLVGVIPICADAHGLRSPVTDAGGWPGQNLPVTCEVAAVPAGGGTPLCNPGPLTDRTRPERSGWGRYGGSIAIDTQAGRREPCPSGSERPPWRTGTERPDSPVPRLFKFVQFPGCHNRGASTAVSLTLAYAVTLAEQKGGIWQPGIRGFPCSGPVRSGIRRPP